MLKFILGNISYFVIMALFVFCCFINEGSLAGKFLVLGFMSFSMGMPYAKKTRFGLVDKRYKEQPVIWWQVLVGIILFAIGILILKINGDFN